MSLQEFINKNVVPEELPKRKDEFKVEWTPGPIDPKSNSPYSYRIEGIDLTKNPLYSEVDDGGVVVLFQNGLLTDVGVNGLLPETLLEILIHKFEGYQSGEFACEENAEAIEGMQKALAAIRKRIEERKSRGVYSTYEK